MKPDTILSRTRTRTLYLPRPLTLTLILTLPARLSGSSGQTHDTHWQARCQPHKGPGFIVEQASSLLARALPKP